MFTLGGVPPPHPGQLPTVLGARAPGTYVHSSPAVSRSCAPTCAHTRAKTRIPPHTVTPSAPHSGFCYVHSVLFRIKDRMMVTKHKTAFMTHGPHRQFEKARSLTVPCLAGLLRRRSPRPGASRVAPVLTAVPLASPCFPGRKRKLIGLVNDIP